METTITVGRGDNKRSVPVSEAAERDLQWYAKECKNQTLREAAQAELARRAADAPAREAKAQALAVQRAETSLGQAVRDPLAITKHLQELAAQYHVVSPATRVDMLPEGCGIAISYVVINPDREAGQVYSVGSKVGLSGDSLKQIAAAAGVDWDPVQSRRLDDGSDPHYCHFRAVGRVRNFDGSVRTVTGEVEIDAREGSPQIDEIRQKAEERESEPNYRGPKTGGAKQIMELRKFLLRHAESKAKNRAISDMGVKRSYAPAELQKPFAVARLMWTGQSDDPEMRRLFAAKTADAMIGGMGALYGQPPVGVTQPSLTGHAPPPVSAARDAYDYETEGESRPPSERPPAPKAEPRGDAWEPPAEERQY